MYADLYAGLEVRTVLAPTGQREVEVAGTAVDLINMRGCVFLVAGGTKSGSGTFSFVIDSSADGVTWAPVVNRVVTDAVGNLIDGAWCFKAGYFGRQRYVRCRIVPEGTVAKYITVLAVVVPLKLPAP